MALAPEAVASSQQAAGPEGDLGLNDVVAGAGRIRFRTQEGQNPIALVIVHAEHDERRHDGDDGRSARRDDPPTQTGEEHHRSPRQADDHGRAQIGLLGHQDERQADHSSGKHKLPRPARVLGRVAMVPAGQRQNETQLHELGRLDTNEAEVQPILGPAGCIAQRGELDQQHHDDQHAIQGVGRAEPPFRVHQGQSQHHREQGAKPDQVLGRPGVPVPARDRIQHGCSDPGDHAKQGRQSPVDLGQFDRQSLALAGTGQGRGCHCGPER